jgi:uncharacterized protein YndB with AHSA1/START domain
MTTPHVPHRVELELQVPGTPEQVWRAIATAEGISSWMMPTDLDAREGGALTFHMGPDGESRGRVTAFEPTRRIAFEEDWATLSGHPDAAVTPLVTEFLVEARSGGTCVVRVVSSAFGTGADWENEFWEEMNTGWAPMLDNLRLYLTHFPEQHARTLWADASFSASPEIAIESLRRALGLESVGDEATALGLNGRLERSIDGHFLLRLGPPVEGFVSFYAFATDAGSGAHMLGYLFAEPARGDVEREQASWQRWMKDVAAGVVAAKRA